eukprot:4946-Heterococcus_DN1.PRE.2
MRQRFGHTVPCATGYEVNSSWLALESKSTRCTVNITQPKRAGEVKSPELLEAVIAELITDSLVIDISSPECPDLTLIDLPGIVRTAVAGQTTGAFSAAANHENSTLAMQSPA